MSNREEIAVAGALLQTPGEVVTVAENDRRWDDYGRPLKEHDPCPRCGNDEIGSLFDDAWCHSCKWRGLLVDLPQYRLDPVYDLPVRW